MNEEILRLAKEMMEKDPSLTEWISAKFPELKESEDERIRKWIIDDIRYNMNNEPLNNSEYKKNAEKAIVWLEKQGNLMKALQISNARIGELIEKNYYLKEQLEKQGKNNMGISEATKQKLEDNLNNVLEKETPESCNEFLERQGAPVPDWMPKFLDELRSKKNYFDWDEHKDIEGEILAIINWMNPNYFNGKDGEKKSADKQFTPEQASVLNEHIDKFLEQKLVWTEEDEEMYAATIFALAGFMGNEDKIDWLKSLKDRVQPQNGHKQYKRIKPITDSYKVKYKDAKEYDSLYSQSTCSEEDEDLLRWTINNLTELEQRFGKDYGKVGECINWIKQRRCKKSLKTTDLENSLCDLQDNYSDTSYEYRVLGDAIEFIRSTDPWKPSDEQLGALWDSIKHNLSLHPVLKSLYNDLKKLREGEV